MFQQMTALRTRGLPAALLLGAVLSAGAGRAAADEADACSHFSWEVAHERAAMRQTPQALTAAVTPDGAAQVQAEHLYEVKLAPQTTVTYAVPPGKAAPDDSAQGGLVHFRVPAAGVYRVSLSTGHWIDVLADGRLLKARDFQGARGCERPHKIVEFELPANQPLTLQLSGASASSVRVAITSAAAPATH